MNIKDVLSLEKLAVPVILLWVYRIVFFLIIPVGILAGIGSILNKEISFGILTIIVGIPVALLAWRIYVELIYVLFGIYKQLQELNAKTKDSTKE